MPKRNKLKKDVLADIKGVVPFSKLWEKLQSGASKLGKMRAKASPPKRLSASKTKSENGSVKLSGQRKAKRPPSDTKQAARLRELAIQQISQLTLRGLISCTQKEVENLLDSDLVIRLCRFRSESLRQIRSRAKVKRIREAAEKLLDVTRLDANAAKMLKFLMSRSVEQLHGIAAQAGAWGDEAAKILRKKLHELSTERLREIATQKNSLGSEAVMLLRQKLPQLPFKELQDIAIQRNALGNEANRVLGEKLFDLSIDQLQDLAIQKNAVGDRAAKLLDEKLRQQQRVIGRRKVPATVPPYRERDDPYWYLEDDR